MESLITLLGVIIAVGYIIKTTKVKFLVEIPWYLEFALEKKVFVGKWMKQDWPQTTNFWNWMTSHHTILSIFAYVWIFHICLLVKVKSCRSWLKPNNNNNSNNLKKKKKLMHHTFVRHSFKCSTCIHLFNLQNNPRN